MNILHSHALLNQTPLEKECTLTHSKILYTEYIMTSGMIDFQFLHMDCHLHIEPEYDEMPARGFTIAFSEIAFRIVVTRRHATSGQGTTHSWTYDGVTSLSTILRLAVRGDRLYSRGTIDKLFQDAAAAKVATDQEGAAVVEFGPFRIDEKKNLWFQQTPCILTPRQWTQWKDMWLKVARCFPPTCD